MSYCGDGGCDPDEACADCPEDCGLCPAVCGDGGCDPGETCADCPEDCGDCPPVCGDATCDPGETCADCPEDCGDCPPVCGDGTCEGAEGCADCPQDCGDCPAFCGDGTCDPDEGCALCPADCGECPTVCGDASCDAGEGCEGCPEDCGDCPTDGCCGSHDAAGCEDPACEAVVCALDAVCCAVIWDATCAASAADYCAVCGGTPPALCGDDECGADETCAGCPEDCGACPPSDCCAEHAAAGCDDEVCRLAVCVTASGCCAVGWDAACVTQAATICEVCGGTPPAEVCGDGLCQASEDCDSCPDDCGGCVGTDCCASHPAGGCDDATCQAAVCDATPSCCEATWSTDCAEAAVAGCAICGGVPLPVCGDGACEAEEDCEGCPADCGACPASDCCVETWALGCGDPACAAIVCHVEPACCDAAWDAPCAEEAAASCTVCGGTPYPYCGDGVCDADEGCEGCPADCGACPTSTCCYESAAPGCDDSACQAMICALDAPCCDAVWGAACAAAAHAHCEVCGGEPVPYCGDGTCDDGEDCVGCPADCDACPASDCCEVHVGLGCDEPVCHAYICDLDPVCCETSTSWDEICVEEATSYCVVCGGTPPE